MWQDEREKKGSEKKEKKDSYFKIPGDSISQTRLEQQVSIWQEFVTDDVLIVAHCYTMAHTQRAQHLQHLEHNMSTLNQATTP